MKMLRAVVQNVEVFIPDVQCIVVFKVRVQSIEVLGAVVFSGVGTQDVSAEHIGTPGGGAEHP